MQRGKFVSLLEMRTKGDEYCFTIYFRYIFISVSVYWDCGFKYLYTYIEDGEMIDPYHHQQQQQLQQHSQPV